MSHVAQGATPLVLARELVAILYRDDDRLRRIDGYLRGRHDDPCWMPGKPRWWG